MGPTLLVLVEACDVSVGVDSWCLSLRTEDPGVPEISSGEVSTAYLFTCGPMSELELKVDPCTPTFCPLGWIFLWCATQGTDGHSRIEPPYANGVWLKLFVTFIKYYVTHSFSVPFTFERKGISFNLLFCGGSDGDKCLVDFFSVFTRYLVVTSVHLTPLHSPSSVDYRPDPVCRRSFRHAAEVYTRRIRTNPAINLH